MEGINKKKLFVAGCFALITTALSFSIRAGILENLGDEYSFTNLQLGIINSMWFLGFPISMVIGGLIYHTVGGKRIMQFAFVVHLLGILMTIFSGGSYIILLISTLFIGLGNGCTEAAVNPMIADAFTGVERSKMLNRFHMWFPGGIVIGSLVSFVMGHYGISWQIQMAMILIPTLIYGYLYFGEKWPSAIIEEAENIKSNFLGMLNPLFIFIFICMALTAISEFGPQQWVGPILGQSGAHPMIILALTTGVMAIARYFGGNAVAQFNTSGVLLISAILATIGLYLLSTVDGPMLYVAAVIFALGIAYFWPNMIGFIADYVPKTGALGMSIVGAVGMFANFIFQPLIGTWIDTNTEKVAAQGFTGEELDLMAGQATMGTMVLFPGILIVLFGILYVWMRNKKPVGVPAH